MSIANFLFSPSIQKILALAYATPGQAFRLSELLDRAGAGRGNGQRQVELLIQAGVLIEEPRRGHQRSIRANTDFALYPELRSICRKSFGLLEPSREALRPFEADIVEAFIFGSVAKGLDTHRSDIDLLVVGTASLLELMEVMCRVEHTLGRPVHLNLYEPAEWADLTVNDGVLAQIAKGERIRVFPKDLGGSGSSKSPEGSGSLGGSEGSGGGNGLVREVRT